jgi:ubiquinone/menaquinone biosynthesis C-methylase UbiE
VLFSLPPFGKTILFKVTKKVKIMVMKHNQPKLTLLPYQSYAGVGQDDPLRFYFWPIVGAMYRRRVELCLAECTGGDRILEVGFGSGVTFLNLHEKYREIHGLDTDVRVVEVAKVFEDRQIETSLQNGNVLCMPYSDDFFDTVLLISILEHLRPEQLVQAFCEIRRVLKPNGQAVYGVPIERPFMVLMFRLLGYNIHEHHFSNEKEVFGAAGKTLRKVRKVRMKSIVPIFGPVYEIGHFVKDVF